MSAPRLELLGIQVDVISRQVELHYNVRMSHGDNDVILAAGASCKLTVPDDQWDRLLAACQGVIDGLSATLGLETSGGAPTGVSLGWTEPTGKPSDEQEL